MAKRIGRPLHSTGQANILSEKQVKTLFTYLNGLQNPFLKTRNVALMTLSFKLGLRAKELASLDVGDVMDSQGGIRTLLRLTSDKTKGAKHRDLPLSNQGVRKALEAYVDVLGECAREQPLFRTQKRNRFSPNSLQQTMKRIFEDAGLEGKFTSHTGRRTFITTLARKGFDLNSIRQLAGHSSLVTTQRYVQNDPKRLSKMVASI